MDAMEECREQKQDGNDYLLNACTTDSTSVRFQSRGVRFAACCCFQCFLQGPSLQKEVGGEPRDAGPDRPSKHGLPAKLDVCPDDGLAGTFVRCGPRI
jgi:hypothetical protein